MRAEVSTIRVSEWDQDASLNQTYLLIPSANADGTDFGTAVVGLTWECLPWMRARRSVRADPVGGCWIDPEGD